MQRSTAFTHWLLAMFLLLVCAVPATAQDGDPEGDGEQVADSPMAKVEKADEAFGSWVVGPLASILFLDLYPFDNEPDEASIREPIYGNARADQKLQRIEAGLPVNSVIVPPGDDAYSALLVHELARLAPEEPFDAKADPFFRRVLHTNPDGTYAVHEVHFVALPELLPILDEPVVVERGGVEISVTNGDSGLVGTATGGAVDLAALGIDLAGAQLVSQDGGPVDLNVNVPEVPFPVTVTETGIVVGGTGPMPDDTVPLVAGMDVPVADGIRATLLATNPEGTAALGVPVTVNDAGNLDYPRQLKIPLVVAWLVMGALFFTLRLAFVNVRMFGHALAVTAGRYDNDDDPGEISHFQALASALSATVGLGNIAGVAIAVGTGGPGAVFWMVLAGVLGMSSKFVECTLGQMYRRTDAAGVVSGGPMHYLSRGITELGERNGDASGKVLGMIVGYPLAALFALMCIGASFGGGNMFQANQSFAALSGVVTTLAPSMADDTAQFYLSLGYGIVLAALVGIVILGGIKRIGVAAGFIVPVMCGIYLMAGIGVLVINYDQVPAAFGLIIGSAFSPQAGFGGLLGVLVVGFQRAAFSNEAGVGSASIAHSAASTPEPVREGVVALLEPFIDTILVCTMTGLVVVVTDAYLEDTGDGVLMTSYAFSTVFSWFPYVLALAVVLFAFSTMISWSYYGERATVWLFGEWARIPYKAVFVLFVVFGSIFKLGNVLTFSDLMVLGMALPNIAGAVLLSGHVARALKSYRERLAAGAFDT